MKLCKGRGHGCLLTELQIDSVCVCVEGGGAMLNFQIFAHKCMHEYLSVYADPQIIGKSLCNPEEDFDRKRFLCFGLFFFFFLNP